MVQEKKRPLLEWIVMCNIQYLALCVAYLFMDRTMLLSLSNVCTLRVCARVCAESRVDVDWFHHV